MTDVGGVRERDPHPRIDDSGLEVGDPRLDPRPQLGGFDQLDQRGLVGHRDQILGDLVVLAAPAELVHSIEDEPPHALADPALLGGEQLEPLPLAAVQPPRHEGAEDVAGAVGATVVHGALDPPDDPLELSGHLIVGVLRIHEDGPVLPVFTTIHRERVRARRVFADMTRCNALLVFLIAGACSSKKPAQAPTQVVAPPTNPAAAAAAQVAQTPAATPNLSIDPKLAARCRLGLSNVEQAPKFEYNDSDLLPADRDALVMIAECLVKGPLAGHELRLIGRADPRGTDEYNLALGTRRADTVRQYHERLGVPAKQLEPTTRGELEATGEDEPGWRRDRRVDLELVN